MKKYLRLAKIPCEGIKKIGLHALRHSLASILLEQETLLPVISEILGHINTNTTRIYTSIDITQLKKCALDVHALATDGGAL